MISKSDFKLSHKELEKIIPEKYRDMALILDDNAEVWKKYRENLVQVYPYYFWDKEFENDEIRAVKHTEYYLHYLGSFLQRAINMFKRYKTEHSSETLKLPRIVKVMHSHLFSDRTVHFTCFVAQNNPEEVLTLREAKIVQQRHAKITLDVEHANIVVANTFKPTKKIKTAKARGIPTVHGIWVKFSVINLCPMSTDFFDITNITEDKLKQPKTFESAMYDHHTLE